MADETKSASTLSISSTLPEEICLTIVENLDIRAVFALSRSSRRFHRLSNPYDQCRRTSLENFLLEAQYFPRWRGDGFACFSCQKILLRESFAEGQRKGKRGLNGGQQLGRFRIQCGLKEGRYCPGSQVVQGNIARVVCRQCQKLEGGMFCQNCAICEGCDRARSFSTLKRCREEWRHNIVNDRPGNQEAADTQLGISASFGTTWTGFVYGGLARKAVIPESFDGSEDVDFASDISY